MNLLQSGFLETLGWSLLDSLWQTGALWIMYLSVTANGQRYSARFRHNLSACMMAAASLWFIAGLMVNLFSGSRYSLASLVMDTGIALLRSSFLEQFMSAVAAAYVCFVPILFARLVWQYLRHRQPLSHTAGMALFSPGSINRVVRLIGLKKIPAIRLSDKIITPMTRGFLKPLILFPLTALNRLTSEQAEAILVHELCHVRRNDYLLNLGLSLAGVVFFFNPFARALLDTMRKERENCCDDLVISLGYDRLAYAEALLILGKMTAHPQALAIAATGKTNAWLLARIRRIMQRNGGRQVFPFWSLIVFFLCLGLFFFGPRNAPAPGRRVAANSSIRVQPGAAGTDPNPVVSFETDRSASRPAAVSKNQVRPVQKRLSYAARPVTGKPANDGREELPAMAAVPLPPAPPAPEAVPTQKRSSEMPAVFISVQPEVMFTNEPPLAPAPDPLPAGNTRLPFVQGSAFYFPDHTDTTATRTVTL